MLVGDGKTVYLKHTGSNFNVLDENKFFVTTGLPEPLMPGDIRETYTATFQTESGKKYYLDNDVHIYTLEPTTLQFEFVVFGGRVISLFAAIFMVITGLLSLESIFNN